MISIRGTVLLVCNQIVSLCKENVSITLLLIIVVQGSIFLTTLASIFLFYATPLIVTLESA